MYFVSPLQNHLNNPQKKGDNFFFKPNSLDHLLHWGEEMLPWWSLLQQGSHDNHASSQEAKRINHDIFLRSYGQPES